MHASCCCVFKWQTNFHILNVQQMWLNGKTKTNNFVTDECKHYFWNNFAINWVHLNDVKSLNFCHSFISFTMNFIKSTFYIFVCLCVGVCHSTTSSVKDAIDMELNKLKAMLPPVPDPLGLNNLVGGAKVNQTYCTCAVFLSGQFVKGSNQPPIGNPALLHEQENVMACNPLGSKQCTNKCLETVI